MTSAERYTSGRYSDMNPDWGTWDSAYKAQQIMALLRTFQVGAASIHDVGCGAGVVLSEIGRQLPEARQLVGWDLRPEARQMWGRLGDPRLDFRVADFTESDATDIDLLMLIDVVEHLENPFDFLRRVAGRARHYVLHIPLDLSAQAILRDRLVSTRRQVGHLHWFTRGVAVDMLADAGYQPVAERFTSASLALPARSLAAKVAKGPRMLANRISPAVSARLVGGSSLLVLATHPASRAG